MYIIIRCLFCCLGFHVRALATVANIRLSLSLICCSFIAFGERKPCFDLWLSRLGYPVHGYMQKKFTFL